MLVTRRKIWKICKIISFKSILNQSKPKNLKSYVLNEQSQILKLNTIIIKNSWSIFENDKK